MSGSDYFYSFRSVDRVTAIKVYQSDVSISAIIRMSCVSETDFYPLVFCFSFEIGKYKISNRNLSPLHINV